MSRNIYANVGEKEEEERFYQNVVSPNAAARALGSNNRVDPSRVHPSPPESPVDHVYDAPHYGYGTAENGSSGGTDKREEGEKEEKEEDGGCCCGGSRGCTTRECMKWTYRIAVKLIVFLAVKIVAIELLRKGLRSLDDCPVEDMIPIFLGVAAIDLLLVCFLRMIKKVLHLGCWERCFGGDGMSGVTTVYDNFVFVFVDIFQSLFTFVWIICGSVWVFRVFQPQYDYPRLPNYCRKDVYLFSFVFLICTYVAAAVMVALFVFRKVTGRRLTLKGLYKRVLSRSDSQRSQRRTDNP